MNQSLLLSDVADIFPSFFDRARSSLEAAHDKAKLSW